MKKIFFTTLFTILTVHGIFAQCILSNTGFESGSSSWNLSPNASIQSTSAHSGSNALALSSGGGSAFQKVKITAGKAVILTAMIRRQNSVSGTGHMPCVSITFVDSFGMSINSPWQGDRIELIPTGVYTQINTPASVPTNADSAIITFTNLSLSSTILLIDEVCLEVWDLPSLGCDDIRIDHTFASKMESFILNRDTLLQNWHGYGLHNAGICTNLDGSLTVRGYLIGGVHSETDSVPSGLTPYKDGWEINFTYKNRKDFYQNQGSGLSCRESVTGCGQDSTNWDFWEIEGVLIGINYNIGEDLTFTGLETGTANQFGSGANIYSCGFGTTSLLHLENPSNSAYCGYFNLIIDSIDYNTAVPRCSDSYISSVVTTVGNVTSVSNVVGEADNLGTLMHQGSTGPVTYITMDLGMQVPIGTEICFMVRMVDCSISSSSNSELYVYAADSNTHPISGVFNVQGSLATFNNTGWVEYCSPLEQDARYIAILDNGGCSFEVDYIKVADCEMPLSNQISGYVYLDENENSVYNPNETGTENIWVYLYSDANNNGVFDVTEQIALDSMRTDSNGFYSFSQIYSEPIMSYILSIDTVDFNTGSYLTTDNFEYAQFTSGENHDANNNFGHSACSLESGIVAQDTGCANEDILFAVSPAISGASYSWQFANATPSISSSPSQMVTWSTSGLQNVSLAVYASAAPLDSVCHGGNTQLDASSSSAGMQYLWEVISGDPMSIDSDGTTLSPTVSPSINSSYRLTVVDEASGCSKVDFVNVHVNVNMNPIASLTQTGGTYNLNEDVFLDGTSSSSSTTNPSNSLNYEWLIDGMLLPPHNFDTLTISADTNTYSLVVIDAVNGCSDTSFASIVPLPVELIGLRAEEVSSNSVVIKWATASETNNDYFEVQRRVGENEEFNTIGKVQGNGNTTSISKYSYIDKFVPVSVGNIYYRLKQVDFDGSYDFSTSVVVDFSRSSLFVVYPNPSFKGSKITIQSELEIEFISIKQLDGTEVFTQNVINSKLGNYSFETTSLRPGMFYVTIFTRDQVVTKRLVVAD